jgi:hypothetical protein
MQNRTGLVHAQVRVAKSLDARHLTEDTDSHIKIIQYHTFWAGLKQVIGDIKPICYATNVNQMDGCCPDSAMRTLAGIYLHFLDLLEVKVSVKMTQCIEKHRKVAYQPLFLFSQILNSFKGLLCFRNEADLSCLKCEALLKEVSQK